MNKFRLVVWSLNWIVALVCGALGVVWYINEPWWVERVTQNPELRPTYGLILFLIALVTVIVNLTFFTLRQLIGRSKRIHVPVKGADPSISISLYALRNALVRALKREPEVHSVDVELTHDRKRSCVSHILARGTIWDGPDILQTTIKMQSVLRNRLLEIVEPTCEPTIEVKLDSLRFVGKRVGFRERIDRIKESFRGPQYPIGGG